MLAKDVEVRCATLVRCAGRWPVSQIWEQSGAERPNLFCAEVAQLAEHSPEKAGVDSSILSLGTIFSSASPVALMTSAIPATSTRLNF